MKRAWMTSALVLGLTACGGSDGSECGEGTVEMEGVCVPTSMIMCGDGTAPDSDGNCVPDGSQCGAGTTFDDGTGECVPDITGCATGTVAMGGECVPDGSVICTDGTEFDATTGTCVPSGEACGEGTVLLDGECRPADEALMAEVFAGAEPDDPRFDGTPVTFTPPAIGEERTIGGCIVPADGDMDGETDYDADWFTFSTAEAGLFRIHADGLGGLSAGFAVLATEGPLADQGWIRVGLNLVGDSSERRVYVPAAGNYVLAVFDSRSLNLDGLDGGVGFSRAVGGPDACYHVTVEAEAVPTPTALTAPTDSGMLGQDPQFFTYTATGRTIFQSEVTEESTAAQGSQVLVYGDTVSSGAIAFSPPVADGDDVLIVVSPVYNISFDTVDYDLTLTEIAEVPADGAVTLTHDDASDIGHFLAFEATAGDVVHLSFTSADELIFIVRNPDLGGAWAPCGAGIFGGPNPCDEADVYYVVEQTGSQLVQVSNTEATDGEMYDVTFTRVGQTPPTIMAGTPAAVTLADERTFVRVAAGTHVWSRFDLSALSGTGFVDADLALLEDAPGPLSAAPSIAWSGVTAASRIHGPMMGGDFLLEIQDGSGTFDGDESVTVGFDAQTFDDVMAAPMMPVSRTGDAIAAGEARFYFVRATAGGQITIDVTGTGGTDPVLEILDANGLPTTSLDDTGSDGIESYFGNVPLAGWVAFAVTEFGGAAGTVDVDIDVTSPPYTSSIGSTSFASICPSGGGLGMQVLDADDGITSTTSFSTFTAFAYFEMPVSGYQVSTNGWLTFDTSYSGGSLFNSQPIGTPTGPNAVVAPFWDDLITEVCVLEEAGRFIVEWSGTDFAGSGTVQFQVVMLGDRSLEFVYGPMHTVARDPSFTVVGLENQAGDGGVVYEMAITGGNSVLWTPAP